MFKGEGRWGVSDDGYRIPRPAQPMHAARDRLQARERRSRAIEGHAGHEHRRQHGQKIGYVETAEQRAFDSRLAPGTLHAEGNSLRGHVDRLRLGSAPHAESGRDPRTATMAGGVYTPP